MLRSSNYCFYCYLTANACTPAATAAPRVCLITSYQLPHQFFLSNVMIMRSPGRLEGRNISGALRKENLWILSCPRNIWQTLEQLGRLQQLLLLFLFLSHWLSAIEHAGLTNTQPLAPHLSPISPTWPHGLRNTLRFFKFSFSVRRPVSEDGHRGPLVFCVTVFPLKSVASKGGQ